jgi:protein translocase SecG subunit
MNMALLVLIIAVSVSIIILTLFQGKGGGLGNAWGNVGGGFQTRRGLEKWLMRLTGVLIAVFLILSVINLVK